MAAPTRSILAQQFDLAVSTARNGWRVLLHRGPSQIQFWFIALAIGVAAGFAALLFRKGIFALQGFLYQTDDPAMIHSHAAMMPWWVLVIIPVCGGLVVGGVLHWLTPDGRLRSVADVIEGAALHEGRVETKAGFASALASLITLSSGGSSGREGPVVHLAGVMASWVSGRINADGITGRDLLGCAVAAAVSASFNAPIAGALFALEVVLRHFAVHAFAPIVIASVAGTVINRVNFGGLTEFVLQTTPGELQFYVELPAFLILGLVSGLIAVALMRSIFLADDIGNHVQRKLGMPRWVRPGIAGLLLGLIAIPFPHIIGVGYETTLRALSGDLAVTTAIVFVIVKVIAVAITIAGRMGGGMFSPSLMVGAISGLAFGLIATGVMPDVSGTPALYAFAGMGAVTAAVLGAPISTTLIVFELTGDWQIGLAVMVSVSMSTALASRLVDRSFFLTMIERRGIHLAAGPQAYLLAMFKAGAVMRTPDDPRTADPQTCWEMIGEGIYVDVNATLEAAMPAFDRAGMPFLPVVSLTGDKNAPELRGALFHVDALKAYNRALAATAAEEHS
ncbi:H(+)/Cl(-) exchange transporter ClcA [Marinibacterium anthonyi]|nr:H(+)/Cl(-) exchange transporter ClcA [Marinibacterium anthonyi]